MRVKEGGGEGQELGQRRGREGHNCGGRCWGSHKAAPAAAAAVPAAAVAVVVNLHPAPAPHPPLSGSDEDEALKVTVFCVTPQVAELMLLPAATATGGLLITSDSPASHSQESKIYRITAGAGWRSGNGGCVLRVVVSAFPIRGHEEHHCGT